MRAGALSLLLLGALGCTLPEPTPASPPWHTDISAPLPGWLSETALFVDLPSLEPAAEAVAYDPPHALWSNGADKARFILLPEGTAIDPTDAAHWAFPVGTVAVKTFTFDDIEGRRGAVPVETRLIFHGADGWDYAVYHWNVEGTEARLLPAEWDEVPLEFSDVSGNFLPYIIPSRLDCRGCHETQTGSPIIGVSQYNLGPALEPLFTEPPVRAAAPARSPEEAAAMGYLVGNCVHCHHGVLDSDNASFSLLPQDLVAKTVGVETESSASGVGVRVVPGDPQGSALYEATVYAGERDYPGDFKPMPPISVFLPDPAAAAILGAWIEGL
jgi:hypothetical protein